MEPLSPPVGSTADTAFASLFKPAAWKPRLPGKLPDETEGQPLHARPRHLDQVKIPLAKAEFQKIEAALTICPSDSPLASPLTWFPSLMVPGALAGITSVKQFY